MDKIKTKSASLKLETKSFNEDRFLSMEEAARVLQISQSSMEKISASNKIPRYKPGKRVFFKESDLLAYMNSSRISSIDEILGNSKSNNDNVFAN